MLLILDQWIIPPHQAPVAVWQMLVLVTPGTALVLKSALLFPQWTIFIAGTTIPLPSRLAVAALVVSLIKLQAYILFLGRVEAMWICPDQDHSCNHSLLAPLTGTNQVPFSLMELYQYISLYLPFFLSIALVGSVMESSFKEKIELWC